MARPNAWQKDVKQTSAVTGGGGITPLNAARQDFFADVLADVVASRPGIRQPQRTKTSWISFASGPFGYWAISFDRENHCQIEAYLDMGDQALTKALFDAFAAEAQRWDTEVGLQLGWIRRDDKRHSRIMLQSQPVNLGEASTQGAAPGWAADAARGWAVDVVVRMYDVLNGPLRTRAQELRQGSMAQPQRLTE